MPTAAEASDGLQVLNAMLDSWLAERLMTFSILISTFPLTPLQQTYTCGPGGNFNMTRPAKIDRISIVSLLNPLQPIELAIPMLSEQEWQQIVVKNIPTTLPLEVYDDAAYPLRNLSYWPIPTIAVNTILYTWQQLTQFPDLVTDLQFPPAYAKAIRYNLALDLAPEFGVSQINPLVVEQALESKGIVKSINMPIVQSYCDSALVGEGGRYNYYSDTVVGGDRN